MRPDGTTANVGNSLGERPSIRLFVHKDRGNEAKSIIFGDQDSLDRVSSPTNRPLTSLSSPETISSTRPSRIIDPQRNLYQAVVKGKRSLVKEAILRGAKVNEQLFGGTIGTVLHVAARIGTSIAPQPLPYFFVRAHAYRSTILQIFRQNLINIKPRYRLTKIFHMCRMQRRSAGRALSD